MDRVRFGRALGYGARHAARALVKAADAAGAPNPAASPASPSQQKSPVDPQSRTTAAPRKVPDARTMRAARQQASRSLVTPVVRFSSVLWLQVTGVFFALVAFTMGAAAWRIRSALHAPAGSDAAIKLYAYAAFSALFAYFAVSSFVRATRR